MEEREQNLYEILGISQNATMAEIKTAYRRRATEYHPDVNPGTNSETCHMMMCKINEAYSVLRNPELRAIYDETLFEKGKYDICDEDCTQVPTTQEASPNESKSKSYNKEYKPNPERYNYYNTVDFDEYMQEEFIQWVESFSYDYLRFAFEYYSKLNIDKDSILKQIYDSFENIIDYEKNYKRKKGKSLSL